MRGTPSPGLWGSQGALIERQESFNMFNYDLENVNGIDMLGMDERHLDASHDADSTPLSRQCQTNNARPWMDDL